jgi:uncharacterized metal-binding protein
MSTEQSGCTSGCSTSCASKVGPTLIFACSGCADVGELADQAARQLTRDGVGKMFCLAGIGGRVPGILHATEAAQGILAIDGCPLDCTKKTLELAGIGRIKHLRLNDLGFEKGKTEISVESIALVSDKAKISL